MPPYSQWGLALYYPGWHIFVVYVSLIAMTLKNAERYVEGGKNVLGKGKEPTRKVESGYGWLAM